jgi:aminoglycoside phosphotransferase (APT) family kinase protein
VAAAATSSFVPVVADSLVLTSGLIVFLGDRTAGGSKNETRFGQLETGQRVVVKVQAHHGRLDLESQTLSFLAGTSVPVPRVVEFGTSLDGRPVLIITRHHGVRATGPAGWQRFGRALAGLSSVPVERWPLEVVTTAEFVADHRDRLRQVATLIDGTLLDHIDDALKVIENNPRPLRLAHGDAGSGNYLDDGRDGTILDWETASVSPFGVDVGRGAFIALMDLGRIGEPIAQHDGFIVGYRSALPDPSALDDETLNAWTIVAALQFIHGRHIQPLRADRTPRGAAQTLTDYLARR